MSRIILNRVMTPDGTILTSRYRHDYVTHTDALTGETYSVDGGLDYLARGGTLQHLVELSVYDNSSHYYIRESLEWGTYGINGDYPELQWIPLYQMTSDHIRNILTDHIDKGVQVSKLYIEFFIKELLYRKENNIL